MQYSICIWLNLMTWLSFFWAAFECKGIAFGVINVCPTWPAPVGESWGDRRVGNVVANLQAHSAPYHLLVVSFIPALPWNFLGMDTGFWVSCATKGLQIQNRGGFFLSPAMQQETQCKVSHVISQTRSFWKNWGLTKTLLVQKCPD